MTIRTADLRDIPELVVLFRTVHSLHATALPALFTKEPPAKAVEAEFKQMVEDPKAMVLLAEDPSPCGYIYAQFLEREDSWFWRAGRICNIGHVVVRSDRRRKGVARALISRILSEASAKGYTRVELDVWSFNQEARTAFQKLGFQVFNERLEFRRIEPDHATPPTAANSHG